MVQQAVVVWFSRSKLALYLSFHNAAVGTSCTFDNMLFWLCIAPRMNGLVSVVALAGDTTRMSRYSLCSVFDMSRRCGAVTFRGSRSDQSTQKPFPSPTLSSRPSSTLSISLICTVTSIFDLLRFFRGPTLIRSAIQPRLQQPRRQLSRAAAIEPTRTLDRHAVSRPRQDRTPAIGTR